VKLFGEKAKSVMVILMVVEGPLGPVHAASARIIASPRAETINALFISGCSLL
jgi:hypothetical protein